MIKYIQVVSTVSTKRNAKKIAERLLEQRLASCVQILGPIRSAYWWKGKIERSIEWMCIVKARIRDYRKIETEIRAMHPYEVPEITAVGLSRGNTDYFNWIDAVTGQKYEAG